MRKNVTEWTLVDWEIESCGGTSPSLTFIYATFDEITKQAHERQLSWWKLEKLPRPTLNGWRKQGIPDKDKIKAMISVLRRMASKYRQSLFSDSTIADDIEKFLTSSACPNGSEYFFSTQDIEEICQLVPINQRMDSFHSLYRRLFPPPPEVLHGRSTTIEKVKSYVLDNIVTVIAALPGQGKTSLAWHIAVDLILGSSYLDFDWTTHKYTQLDIRTGEKKRVDPVKYHQVDSQKSTLDFDDVLVSMSHRFNWTDARALSRLDRENKCAELLATRKYLIVLDNIETLPDIESAIEYFSKLRGYGIKNFNSRILITSRQGIYGDNIRLVDLEGIDKDGVDLFFSDLATNIGVKKWRNLSQQLGLWEACSGNPLLMMIAFYRIALGNNFESIVKSIKGIDSGFEGVFNNMFGDFISELNPAYVLLAKVAAEVDTRGITISFSDLRDAWTNYIYPAQNASLNKPSLEAFNDAIQELRKYRILTLVDIGQYAMHPLIRVFLANSQR